MKKVWFITGISSGLGKAIAGQALNEGHFVVGTFRSREQAQGFTNTSNGNGLGLVLDVTSSDDIKKAYHAVRNQFSQIDVLVNNAGFGFAGAIEETSMAETRAIFEANFFGSLMLTQIFLPWFREQKSGHIVQISSHGGFKAFPGFGIYNASKFALEGFSEALATEVGPLGIKVTIVEPGPFRTNFAGDSFKQAKKIIDDYQQTAGTFRERMKQVHGKQEGDPEKAANAILEMVGLENPPLRLPLGKIAISSINAKLESVKNDVTNFRTLAESVVF